ncbi:phosphate-starvation-inducible protein PsiE [Gemelliphila palaticanis]|uniref:Protein PsiE n=1 Tax=Gemelliphila palaticanis TaxID=81950 RepID=A0ABX2SX40_9BACL|nr:phosphate-starvation-inducible protein PsiE [Gemella palaticanis]MBF0714709.1 phosphate-starvation-inducible protein PsiE [Gemella palaticanis]NYS46639.1 phosphate-starvation-inducible protein PsiE [Gemella palaticanis]
MLEKIANYLLIIKNIALIIVAIFLCIVLFVEAWAIAKLAIQTFHNDNEHYNIVEKIIYFFLYFEFIALIIKYFKNNFHFPLRYFIYIGITAIIRLIIVDHDIAINVLIWGSTILVLSISLAIVNRFVKHD